MSGSSRKLQAATDLVAACSSVQLALAPRLEKNRIVPVLRAAHCDDVNVRLGGWPDEDSPVFSSFSADLIVMYAFDVPGRLHYVTHQNLHENDITKYGLHAMAVRNLPSLLQEIQMQGESPCYRIKAGGAFEASLLLHETLWEQMSRHVPGEPMVVAPAHDALFVTGSDWDGAHQFLSEMANRDLPLKTERLSKRIFIRQGGKWFPYAASA